MHERVLGDVGVGHNDGLPVGILDGRVAPGDVLYHARHAADLDIVAGLDDAHKGHLHAADKVRQRVLKAERDGNAADAKSGDERVCVNAKAVVEDKAAANHPDDGARNVDEDTRCRKRVIVAVEQVTQRLGNDFGGDGGAYRQDASPDDVVDPPLLKEMKNRLKQFHVGKTSSRSFNHDTHQKARPITTDGPIT